MKTIAPIATLTNTTGVLIWQRNIAKPSFSQTESIENLTVRGEASEEDIWKQLEPIYSWIGI
jgi:hypothetical protein